MTDNLLNLIQSMIQSILEHEKNQTNIAKLQYVLDAVVHALFEFDD